MGKRQRVKSEIQFRIRQRARFKCENCDKFSRKQYAHIIPDSEGGLAGLNNILWLCYECHGNFEAEGKLGLLRQALIENMQRMRDRPKMDSLVDGLFDELVAHPDQPINIVLGSVGFRGIETLFSEPDDSYRPAFLKFFREEGRLNLEGHLKDIDGFTLIEFSGTNLHFHTKDIWDIERRAQYLKVYSKSRKIWIELRQNDDLSVFVKGEIYAGGKIISISKSDGMRFPEGGGISNLTLDGTNASGVVGIRLPPSPIPRPFGHINPNVRLD